MPAPPGGTTRPTTDRVRESVFAQIVAWRGRADEAAGEQLRGLRFLDLYAGSGAVGFEAVSRGATATWVERNRAVTRLIASTQHTLGVAGRVVTAAVVPFLRTGTPEPYDVVWADPPYDVATTEIDALLAALAGRGWLTADGLVVVERASRGEPPQFPEILTDSWIRRYGDTSVYFAPRRVITP